MEYCYIVGNEHIYQLTVLNPPMTLLLVSKTIIIMVRIMIIIIWNCCVICFVFMGAKPAYADKTTDDTPRVSEAQTGRNMPQAAEFITSINFGWPLGFCLISGVFMVFNIVMTYKPCDRWPNKQMDVRQTDRVSQRDSHAITKPVRALSWHGQNMYEFNAHTQCF